MTQAVIYTRFSPRRNAGECESCDTQESICRDFAARQGWPVRSVHRDEAVSGSEWPRPGLLEAVDALQRGDVLLTWRRDRIARDVFVAESVQRMAKTAGATVRTTDGADQDDSPQAVAMRQMMDVFAELERKIISARTRATMQQHQRNGRKVGRYAPYGFRAEGKRLVPVPREQAAVRRILELAEQGQTPWHIARTLNEEHPDAARGKEWSRYTIGKIIRRPPVVPPA